MLRQVSNLGHLGKSGLVPATATHFPGDPGHVTQILTSKGDCAQGRDAENPRCLVSPHLSSQHTQLISHPSNILNFAVSVCVAVQKETEIMYNPPVFCKWSLNEGQFSSQVVYLPSLTGVLLTRECVDQGTRELVLSSATSGFACLKGAPTAAWCMGFLLWKDTWSHRQILFLVSVLFPILVNQSFKPFFVPTLFVLRLRLHPWAPAVSLAQVGLQFTQQSLVLSAWTRSNKSWPHTAQSQREAGVRDGCEALSDWNLLLLLFVVLHLVEWQVIPLYKHIHFWAPSQALKQQLWLVRWDKINRAGICSSNHYWK